jgi:phage shock protein C
MTERPDVKRLQKSRTDRMIDGVCGGVAEYFGLDPTLVRIATVLLAIFGGAGILLYIVAMIIMPAGPVVSGETPSAPAQKQSKNNDRFWGILLVLVGVVWLMAHLGVHFWHPFWGLPWGFFLPLLLIMIGVAFLFGGRNYISSPSTPAEPVEPSPAGAGAREAPPRRLYRSRVDRKILGVCAGLGAYFNIDPTIVRLLFVIAALASFGFTLLIYVVMGIIVPAESGPIRAT